MLQGYGRYSTTANMAGRRSFAARANTFSGANAVPAWGYGGGGNGGVRVAGFNASLSQAPVPMLDGIVNHGDKNVLNTLYRDIYLNNSAAGMTVDLMSSLAFNDLFTLGEIKDRKVIDIYLRNMENLRLKSLLPALSLEYLVIGNFIGSLNWDKSKKMFTSITPQDIINCDLQPVPLFGTAPLITLNYPKELISLFARSQTDPRLAKIYDSLPEVVRRGLTERKLPLDPDSTLFISRTTFPSDYYGTSFYRRIVGLYILEKALTRGTIDQSHRRQRSITVVNSGDDEWTPTDDELDAIGNIIAAADNDPVSAILSLRSGVNFSDLKRGDDFWKISDMSDYITANILNALGVSQDFLAGNVTINSADTALSVFVDSLRAFRDKITRVAFYDKLFPIIAYSNELLKPRNMALASHDGDNWSHLHTNISKDRNGSYMANCADSFGNTPFIDDITKYWIPIVHWNRSLLPEADACIVADSLITTENGLIEIGDMKNKNVKRWHDLGINVLSRFGVEKAAKWLYNGEKPTLKINTDLGNDLECTYNQPLLVLNDKGETEWRRADQLKRKDVLCIATEKLVRKKELNLALFNEPSTSRIDRLRNLGATKPDIMTPQLAFLIGALISEGTITRNYISFPNTDINYINKIIDCFRDIFSIKCVLMKEDPDFFNNSSSFISNLPIYTVMVYSVTIYEWLEQLGLYCGGTENGKTASFHKIIPWSILQADEQSQLAFIAAYIEGDGTIFKDGITIPSVSKKLLNQFQILLNSHGIISQFRREGRIDRIAINYGDALILWEGIKPYMVTKCIVIKNSEETRGRKLFGIPSKYWRNIILNRRIKSAGYYGFWYSNDEGIPVKANSCRIATRDSGVFCYDSYINGYYDDLLKNLAIISYSAYIKLINLFNLRYKFVNIIDIVKGGIKPVFDLSMDKNTEPAFVANGIIIHNTYLSFLQEMNALGYPITMATLAGVGGFSLDQTLGELEQDLSNRQKIADYNKAIQEMNPQSNPATNQQLSFALATLLNGGIRPRPAREFDPDKFGPYGNDHRGLPRPLSTKGKKQALDTYSKTMATAMAHVARRNNFHREQEAPPRAKSYSHTLRKRDS